MTDAQLVQARERLRHQIEGLMTCAGAVYVRRMYGTSQPDTPARKRVTVFLSEAERQLIERVQPDDVSLSATIRRLALSKAEWLADNGYKQRARQKQQGDSGSVTYDYSDAQ